MLLQLATAVNVAAVAVVNVAAITSEVSVICITAVAAVNVVAVSSMLLPLLL